MIPDLTDVCGAAVAEMAQNMATLDAALVDMVQELKHEDCTRENILGAAGILGWAAAFHSGEKVSTEIMSRAALLTLIACYSGGLRRRYPSDLYQRLYFKAEIRENAGANAEAVGCLDVAALHFERACTLRAQAIGLMYR